MMCGVVWCGVACILVWIMAARAKHRIWDTATTRDLVMGKHEHTEKVEY